MFLHCTEIELFVNQSSIVQFWSVFYGSQILISNRFYRHEIVLRIFTSIINRKLIILLLFAKKMDRIYKYIENRWNFLTLLYLKLHFDLIRYYADVLHVFHFCEQLPAVFFEKVKLGIQNCSINNYFILH